MARVKAIFGDVFLYAVGAFIALTVYAGLWFAAQQVPGLESSAFPIIGVGPVLERDTYRGTYRDKEIGCFRLHLTKLRSGKPIDYKFYADTTSRDDGIVTSPQLGLSAYSALPDHSRDTKPWQEHKVGESWPRLWCFEIPGTVATWQDIIVSGTAYHRRHWLYDTQTPIPSFVIKGDRHH